MTAVAPRFDAVIHPSPRLQVCGLLAAVADMDFAVVRDQLQVSDSVLSKTVSALEKAGYVEVRKGYVGKRPRTWLRLSARGRQVYDQHVEALRQIAEGSA